MIVECTECGKEFSTSADQFGEYCDVCHECELEWTQEDCPELLGNNYDANDGTEGSG